MNRGQACGYEYISMVVCQSPTQYLHAIALHHDTLEGRWISFVFKSPLGYNIRQFGVNVSYFVLCFRHYGFRWRSDES